MKNITTSIILPIILISIGWGLPNFSWASVEVDGICYELDSLNNTAQVVSGQYQGDIIIPVDILYEGKTYSITSIGESAFTNGYVLSVTIGDNVTTIGKKAFYYCHALKSVTLGKGVTTIGELAFSECANLRTITIPGNVSNVGPKAFEHCLLLASVVIEDGVSMISQRAFALCYGLTDLSIGNGVETIGDMAFYACRSLTSVVVPNSVTTIGEMAFQNCDELKTVTLGDGVKTIGSGAFSMSEELSSLTMGENVTTIGDGAFYQCWKLSSVTIPASVVFIGNNAFRECQNLEKVTINSDSIMSKDYCFTSMFGISVKEFVIGEGVTTIGEEAFENNWMSKLSLPSSLESIGMGAFKSCYNLESVIIPDGVTEIKEFTFYLCASLTSVTIGSQAKSIGNFAFSSCQSLTSITVRRESPASIWSSTFSEFDKSKCTLYVPQGSKSAYAAADYWKEFPNIVESQTGLETVRTDETSECLYDLQGRKLKETPRQDFGIRDGHLIYHQ